MVIVLPPALGPAAGEILVITGAETIVATSTGAPTPLLIPFVITSALNVLFGTVLNVTVNWVAVALVTVPVPLLKITVLLAAIGSKPVPVMVSVAALFARLLKF